MGKQVSVVRKEPGAGSESCGATGRRCPAVSGPASRSPCHARGTASFDAAAEVYVPSQVYQRYREPNCSTLVTPLC